MLRLLSVILGSLLIAGNVCAANLGALNGYGVAVASSTPTIMDYYSESNFDGDSSNVLYGANYIKHGQSFTGDGRGIVSTKFFCCKVGSPTGNATSSIFNHSGTFGASSVGTGSALGTSGNFDVSTLPSCGSWPYPASVLVEFTFSSPVSTVNGTKYVAAIEYSGGDADNKVQVNFDNSSPSHGGNWTNYWGGWAANSATDVIFYVYGQ